ncbi:MAG: hypothetical protein Q9157_000482 [Trypethelium eluteriae]
MPFKSPTISSDIRLACLLKHAIRNLVNVQTLRILYGHWLLTVELITGFFDRYRPRNISIRRLWLENCSIEGIFQHEQDQCDFDGLEVVRFRRMRLAPTPIHATTRKVLMRGGIEQAMHDGKGGLYYTTLHDEYDISMFNKPLEVPDRRDLLDPGLDEGGYYIRPGTIFDVSKAFDTRIYDSLPGISELVSSEDGYNYIASHQEVLPEAHPSGMGAHLVWMDNAQNYRQMVRLRAAKNAPAKFAASLLAGSMATLTSLNLDWVFLVSHPYKKYARQGHLFMPLLENISRLRFPNLRAFQLRNAVTRGVLVHDLVPLFGTLGLSFLAFMEAHRNLKCLGWPMAQFFTQYEETLDTRNRIDQIIDSLSTSIIDLRIDARYNDQGEPHSQVDERIMSFAERKRRRLFITHFASRMRSVAHVKIEGCIPRDERRETLRALRHCPLQRIVSIGVSSPLGNTWGENGNDIGHLEDGHFLTASEFLEAEDIDTVVRYASSPLQPPQEPYVPTFGPGPQPPMLHMIASLHAATVTELKFCGYQGSPILGSPTAITDSFLYPLRHFHALRQLVLSMWILTFFEDDWRDREIIDYWLNARDSSSTALVPLSGDEKEDGAWAAQLRSKYAPDMLARQVRDMVAKHLSSAAKGRKGGVRVRASFSLGSEPVTSNIFDIDVRIGINDEILRFKGPREELEPERRKEKLEQRRWF